MTADIAPTPKPPSNPKNWARLGADRERRVLKHLAKNQWRTLARSAGSHGPADLVMVHPIHGIALIQVGTQKKALGPADRTHLCDLADLAGALPLLATPIPGVGYRYRVITRGKPETWQPFDPTTPTT